MGLALLLAAALLAGCGGGAGERGTRARALDLVRGVVLDGVGLAPEPPARPTREGLEALGFAVVVADVELTGRKVAFAALTENDGRVTYVASDRASLVIDGAQVVGTHRLGTDLAGYRSDPGTDPVRRARPLADWPAEVVRVYRHRDATGRAFSRTAVCRPRVTAAETEVDVYGRALRLAAVEEPCRTPAHAFVNRYWLEAGTGRIWKSRQWVSPETGSVGIEVIRPFG